MSLSGLDGLPGFVNTHRVCRVCGRLQEIGEFRQIVTDQKTYRRFQCRSCERLMARTIREDNALNWDFVKRRRESQKRYRGRNSDKIKEYQREYHRKYRARKKAERHGQYVDR